MIGTKTIYIIGCFKNVLCIPFIKCSMINVRKMIQMSIIISE